MIITIKLGRKFPYVSIFYGSGYAYAFSSSYARGLLVDAVLKESGKDNKV